MATNTMLRQPSSSEKGCTLCPDLELSISPQDNQYFIVQHDRGPFGRRGQVEVLDEDNRRSILHMREYKRPINQDTLVIEDDAGTPSVLILQDRFQLSTAYTIYAANPLNEGDHPREQELEKHFYPWYKVHLFHHDQDRVKDHMVDCWNGHDFSPLAKLILTRENNGEIVPGVFELMSMDGNTQMASLERSVTHGGIHDSEQVRVVVKSGVDPVLILCISAVL